MAAPDVRVSPFTQDEAAELTLFCQFRLSREINVGEELVKAGGQVRNGKQGQPGQEDPQGEEGLNQQAQSGEGLFPAFSGFPTRMATGRGSGQAGEDRMNGLEGRAE